MPTTHIEEGETLLGKTVASLDTRTPPLSEMHPFTKTSELERILLNPLISSFLETMT